MLNWFRNRVLFSIVLFSSFRVAAQLAMPDNVSAGTAKHYYVDPNPVPGSSYTWKINGVTQVSSANEIDIIWNDAGTYLLEVQELSADGCPGPLRSGQVFVSAPPILVDSADLSIAETVNNTHPIIGSTVFFTIIATNNLPENGTGVTVSGNLPDGYTYVSSSATTGIYDPLTGIWTIGSLPSGASESLIITVTVNSTGYYFNTVTIQGNEPDGNLINNVAVAGTYPTDFFIPEGFSPNSDGINDLFVIRGITSYPFNSIVIFNRWGSKVLEAGPYQNNWDGRSSNGLSIGGDELPAGTYFFLLDLGDGSEVIKGTIYLNR